MEDRWNEQWKTCEALMSLRNKCGYKLFDCHQSCVVVRNRHTDHFSMFSKWKYKCILWPNLNLNILIFLYNKNGFFSELRKFSTHKYFLLAMELYFTLFLLKIDILVLVTKYFFAY